MSFITYLESDQWNDAVVETIGLGQRVGYGWLLYGSIYDDPSGWSNRTNVSGVESIKWSLLK